jgi:hypothetical protein
VAKNKKKKILRAFYRIVNAFAAKIIIAEFIIFLLTFFSISDISDIKRLFKKQKEQ